MMPDIALHIIPLCMLAVAGFLAAAVFYAGTRRPQPDATYEDITTVQRSIEVRAREAGE
jgi:hypothetical protein